MLLCSLDSLPDRIIKSTSRAVEDPADKAEAQLNNGCDRNPGKRQHVAQQSPRLVCKLRRCLGDIFEGVGK